jgi:hypothetical protein
MKCVLLSAVVSWCVVRIYMVWGVTWNAGEVCERDEEKGRKDEG